MNLKTDQQDFIQSEQEIIDWKKKNEQSLTDLWDKSKRSNSCIFGVPKGKRVWG